MAHILYVHPSRACLACDGLMSDFNLSFAYLVNY